MSRPAPLALPLLVALACGGAEREKPPVRTETAPVAQAPAPPVVVPPAAASERPWVDDDWPTAKARALAEGKPVVIDMWAPWCHTCLSMQQTVLRDPALQEADDDFVWLAIDTDKPENAELVAALPMSMWPTFFIVDPADLSVHARFAGAASVEQFVGFLAGGEASFKPTAEAAKDPDSPAGLLRQALAKESAGGFDEADALLARALERAEPGWPRRADTWVERLRLLRKAKRWDDCVDAALAGLPEVETSRSASVTDFSFYARTCSGEAKADSPSSRSVTADLRARLDGALARLDADPDAHLSVDDRSDLLANWRELALASKDPAKAKALAIRQRDLLNAAWADVGVSAEAMTYMWPRAEVHVFLGEGAALVDDYEAMVLALPKSYEPPYRLAWLLLQLDLPDDARPHAKAAISRLYGPRKTRALALLIQIEAKADNTSAQRDAQAELVALWESLPAGQQDAKALLGARAELAKLDAELLRAKPRP